jgi:hypothetical protein
MNTSKMKVVIVETDYYKNNPMPIVSMDEYLGYKDTMVDLKVGDRILPAWCRTERDKVITRRNIESGQLGFIFMEVVNTTDNEVQVRPCIPV